MLAIQVLHWLVRLLKFEKRKRHEIWNLYQHLRKHLHHLPPRDRHYVHKPHSFFIQAPMDNVYGREQQIHISLRGFKNKTQGDIHRFMINYDCDKEPETWRGVKRQHDPFGTTTVKPQTKLTDMHLASIDVIMKPPIVFRANLPLTLTPASTPLNRQKIKLTLTSALTPMNRQKIKKILTLQLTHHKNVTEYVAYILHGKTKNENLD